MDSIGIVPILSSKAPAYDGPGKAGIGCFWLDGSSGAAAMVSGITLLLQEAYKTLNNDKNPPAALIKATLINSADDVGNSGIDFESGYGRANAWRAMQILQQKQYYNEIITKEETLTFPINIPTNAKNLKITLAWSDIPAAPNAEKALVNDLDIILYHAASQQNWLPWVLNHFPHPDSLAQLPTRKADHLNNVEQITLENPIPGNYDIQVNGFNITTNFQEFSIVYQFDTLNHFQWTFPAQK
ncbi:MAG: S8 family serine peptidase [Saprospiraceae bacterium]|nr:S8 family serine peptidase [Saprospiraceae bacterium]